MIGDFVETKDGLTIVETITQSGINGQFDKYWNKYFFDATEQSEVITPIQLTQEWFDKNDIKVSCLNEDEGLRFVVGKYEEENYFEYVISTEFSDHGTSIYITKEINFVHEYQQCVRMFENREITIK